jgi:hypothetical protein
MPAWFTFTVVSRVNKSDDWDNCDRRDTIIRLAEQDGEWPGSRRYPGLEILAVRRKSSKLSMRDSDTSETGMTVEVITH